MTDTARPAVPPEGVGSATASADPGALLTGLVGAALILPVFAYRHYYRDKGHFPESMYETGADGVAVAPTKRAGTLPYLVLAGGVVIGQILAGG